jgi:hypothetical protein
MVRFFRHTITGLYMMEFFSRDAAKRATISAAFMISGNTYLFTVGHIFRDSSPIGRWPTDAGDDTEFDIYEDEEDEQEVLYEVSHTGTSAGSLSPEPSISRNSSYTQVDSLSDQEDLAAVPRIDQPLVESQRVGLKPGSKLATPSKDILHDTNYTIQSWDFYLKLRFSYQPAVL